MTDRRSQLAGMLGLGHRSRGLVVGVGQVREALRRGSLACVIVAEDASDRTADKVVRLAQARGVEVLTGSAARVMGQALGRDRVQAVGVVDTGLARGMVGLELPPWPRGGVSGKNQST